MKVYLTLSTHLVRHVDKSCYGKFRECTENGGDKGERGIGWKELQTEFSHLGGGGRREVPEREERGKEGKEGGRRREEEGGRREEEGGRRKEGGGRREEREGEYYPLVLPCRCHGASASGLG